MSKHMFWEKKKTCSKMSSAELAQREVKVKLVLRSDYSRQMDFVAILQRCRQEVDSLGVWNFTKWGPFFIDNDIISFKDSSMKRETNTSTLESIQRHYVTLSSHQVCLKQRDMLLVCIGAQDDNYWLICEKILFWVCQNHSVLKRQCQQK